jgi:DNA-binding NtrC family response regulator
LDPACQIKILHALPDGDAESPSARVISVTRHNLEQAVRAGKFREELYFRLNGICLNLPPLRQRREDIPALSDFFLIKYASLFGRPKPQLSECTRNALMDYSWPGNIRELENTIQKIVALGDESIVVADLHAPRPKMESQVAPCISLKQAARAASRQAEKELILQVLSQKGWNRKHAAQELQISYKALLYKMKQTGLDMAGK